MYFSKLLRLLGNLTLVYIVSCKIVKIFSKPMKLTNSLTIFLSNPKKYFSKPLRLLGNLTIMQWIVIRYLGSHVLVVLFVFFL